MEYYADERKRIGDMYKFLSALFLLYNFSYTQFYVNHNLARERLTGEAAGYIPFFGAGIWCGALLLLIYMNYRLFWIREQGRNTFLPLKYIIIPIAMKDIYLTKIKIMARAVSIYVLLCMACYFFILWVNAYPAIEAGRSILEILQAFLFETVCLLVLTGYNVWTHRKTERTQNRL